MPNSSEWVCSDRRCGNVNFSKRDRCSRCDSRRRSGQSSQNTQLGKRAAELSKGLFSPEDWSCKSCGNVNWARRSTCNVCNNPRISKQGERTGYGGGFMERDEVVEYKRHNDSDDEFDEFGRKRKRTCNSSAAGNNEVPSSAAHEEGADLPASTKSESANGSDEESGDDADLSKYALWDDDNDSVSNAPTGDKTNGHRSRTTSESSSDSSSSSSTGGSSNCDSRASDSSSSSTGRDDDKQESHTRSRFEAEDKTTALSSR